jgi:hypothetical protein
MGATHEPEESRAEISMGFSRMLLRSEENESKIEATANSKK